MCCRNVGCVSVAEMGGYVPVAGIYMYVLGAE